jgi:MbtH protein
MSDEDDDRGYKVVVNHEEQYSIWLNCCEIPLGWSEAGFLGKRQECLDWIAKVWTDMRPLSLRRAMERPKTTDDKHSAKPEGQFMTQ